jgi:hypothetical protein
MCDVLGEGIWCAITPIFRYLLQFYDLELHHFTPLGMLHMAALGSMDIFVRSRCGVDPSFHLPTFGPSDGRWKVWLFMRNDTDVPLPVLAGSRPSPKTTGGTVWLKGTSAG